jgi:UDP-galactose transporter B1
MQHPRHTCSSHTIQHQQLLDDVYYSAPPTTTSTVVQNTVELLVAEETEKYYAQQKGSKSAEYLWLAICFFGIMGSFVAYGLLLEYATSGGKQLHELSFLFITSLLYTMTASVGRYARAETPSTIPPAQFAVLGLTSMGSTFFSVRALRYVIYPIQVLAKSCKPVPVMLMGALMGKKYPMKKYLKVALIVAGVGLFMGGG